MQAFYYKYIASTLGNASILLHYQEVNCFMKAQRRTREEQYQLILECRSSGMSDHNWCKEHNIKPGTFYNWVKRLRKAGGYEIPSPAGQDTYAPTPKPDIVKVELMDETPVVRIHKPKTDPIPDLPSGYTFDPSLELVMDGVHLRISNHIDPELLAQTIFLIRGQ